MIKSFIFFILLVPLSLVNTITSSSPIEDNIMQKKNESTPPQVTIWIHGTLFWFRYIIPKFLHIEQGLTPLSCAYDKHYYRSIAQELEKKDPQRFSFHNFYLFGWSGILSFEKRFEAANNLNSTLKDLVAEYQKNYNQKPFIRIITHSHGGNVALNLANLKDFDIEIDELILLACPVQEKTESFAYRPCFKNVISLYSKTDFFQILDPQGFYTKDFRNLFQENLSKKPFFSQRKFQPYEKIVQAQIKINDKSLFHVDFMLEKFLKHLPEILDSIKKQKKEHLTAYFKKPLKLKLTLT